MALYNNLGFTEREIALINQLIETWRGIGCSLAHDCIFTNAGDSVNREIPDDEAWDGKYHLSVLERSGPFTAVLDTGYGKLFLIDTDVGLVYYANGHVCAGSGAVMIDAEYYGTNYWLYVHEKE